MDPVGKSPISPPVLILGKAALACCLAFGLVRSHVNLFYDSDVTRWAGALLAAAGVLIVVTGFVFLGRSVAVGLPREKTELKTHGVFRFTRNPLYLGSFLACAGSCLYSLHVVNLLLCLLTIWIHHRIILKEEEFLQARFGRQWLEYARRVPRYLGAIHRQAD